MTHGCIRIFHQDDDRSILLHTHHTGDTGYLTKIVKESPAFMALHRFEWLTKSLQPCTIEELAEMMECHALGEGHDNPPTVASWLIAFKPGVLEPVPHEFIKDLATWSGADHPCVLTISERQWVLSKGGLKKTVRFDPVLAMVEAIYAKAKANAISNS